MAKKRKTRAQKKLSDFRHNFTHAIVNQAVLKPQIQFQPARSTQALAHSDFQTPNSYLVKDLSKTGGLTFAILIGQVILYFLLTNHIFKIPGLNY